MAAGPLAAAPFTMHGAREVLAPYAGAAFLERQINLVERAVTEDPGLALDLCKTLVESVCKTILADRGYPISSHSDLPDLVRDALQKLQLVPEGRLAETRLPESIRRTIGSLYGLIRGICELRNLEGVASHGKDAYTLPPEPVQAQLAARAADAIVHFLVAVHQGRPSTEPSRRLAYTENDGFNDYVDANNPPVQIFDLSYPPSEVLFSVDREAYRIMLAEYASQSQDERQAPESGGEVSDGA